MLADLIPDQVRGGLPEIGFEVARYTLYRIVAAERRQAHRAMYPLNNRHQLLLYSETSHAHGVGGFVTIGIAISGHAGALDP